jgi:Domain of unknown function (DUF4145)
MRKIARKAFCPLDGYPTEQRLELTRQSQPFGDYTLYMVEPAPKKTYYYVAVCKMCNGVMLYSAENDDIEESFPKAELLWPVLTRLSHKVPSKIRKYYDTALRFKNHEPDLYGSQIRRGLEAICDDRGINGREDLYTKIEKLTKREQLPTMLREMMQALRKVCNFAAHDSHIKPEYVLTIDMFFRALLEYVYVIPVELEQFYIQLNLAAKYDHNRLKLDNQMHD